MVASSSKVLGYRRAPWKTRKIWIVLPTRRYGTMNGVLGITSSRVPGTRPGRPISGLFTLRGCQIVLLDMGPQRDEVGNRLRRPDWCHERLGTGFSFALPHEATQSLTRCCGTPSPRSSEAMARLMPLTCHSLTSRYSWIASAARKERLRPVLFANRSSRFFTPVSPAAQRRLYVPGRRNSRPQVGFVP